MDRVVDQLGRFLGRARSSGSRPSTATTTTPSGRRTSASEVWLSRKGAISARGGQPGLIPGSMGTASYVVVGKGNVPSLMLRPHGAGRNYSRTRRASCSPGPTSTRGWPASRGADSDAFLDEHPDAYKDIDVVMRDAADLVEVRHTLRQVVNVKGD